MLQFSFWDILSNLLIATQWTIVLSLIAFLCGGIVGLILLFMRTSQIAPLEWFTKIYIEFFQGTPLLMQLFLFFFGIALFDVEVSPWMAATMALTFWTSAFLAEIWRGFVELTKAGTMLTNATFRPFVVSSLVALIYFCLCFPLSVCAKKLESRLNV